MEKKKAYVINTSNFSQPWHYDHYVYYADTRNKARTEALRDVDGAKDKWDEEITLLTLNLKRDKSRDKILVDGVWKTNHEIDQDKQLKERNDHCDKLVIDNPNGFAYIRKGGYYYRPNSAGYTEYIKYAGVYPVKQAAAEVKGCDMRDCMDMILVDIDQHNAMINSEIETLKNQLIK